MSEPYQNLYFERRSSTSAVNWYFRSDSLRQDQTTCEQLVEVHKNMRDLVLQLHELDLRSAQAKQIVRELNKLRERANASIAHLGEHT